MPDAVVLGIGVIVLAVPPLATVYHFKSVPVAISVTVPPTQTLIEELATTGAVGRSLILTTVFALGLSQAPSIAAEVCVTKYSAKPTVAVEGVGALVEAVPPLASVYHFKFEPVAVNALAVTPLQ